MSTDQIKNRRNFPAWAKYLLLAVIGITLLLAVSLVSVRFGASDTSYHDVWAGIFHFDPQNRKQVILRQLRFPRIGAAMLVGAGLAVSGAIMQGITRNPLGDPSILGISSGAGFAVAIAFAVYGQPGFAITSAFSLLGAGLAVALVFLLAGQAKGGDKALKLALAGACLSALLNALSTGIGILFGVSKNLSYWFAGSLQAIQPMHIQLSLPLFLAGLGLAFALAPALSILSLGEEAAKGLGLHVTRVRILATFAVLLLTGAAVSIAGFIGFVGLAVPHMVRILLGPDYRLVLPFSALLGALLLVLADWVSRMINPPFETPVGVITALIGLPFFLYLARKKEVSL